MKEQKKHHDPLPEKFASYEEAAEFWDTHDTTDYPDAFEDVEVKAEFRKRYFEIEIDEDVMVTLQRKANKLGVAVDRLASDLLRQQLQQAM